MQEYGPDLDHLGIVGKKITNNSGRHCITTVVINMTMLLRIIPLLKVSRTRSDLPAPKFRSVIGPTANAIGMVGMNVDCMMRPRY